MMMTTRRIFRTKLNNNKGSVLLTSYLVITVLLLLGTAFFVMSSNEGRASEVQRKVTQAFYMAEAGIERALYDLKEDFADNQDWTDGNINGISIGPDTNNFYSIPYTGVSLNGGSYAVSLKNVTGTDDIWIRSTGTIDSIGQTILVYVRIFDLSPWNNAIFAGAGSTNTTINGNVNIHGSVHILGDGLADGDNAIDLGGTAELVRNNYDGLDPLLEAKVPVLPTTVVNGETVETLNAELRVRKGLVGLSGSSTVGEADSAGDGEKETVDGAYVTDGYNGNQGAINVFSDNGTSQAYDLGDEVSFPKLSDASPQDSLLTVQEYYASQTNFDAATKADLVAHLNNVKDTSVFTDYEDVNLNGVFDSGDNGISMDGSGNMVVYGRVYVEGAVNIGGDPTNPADSSNPITYSGAGTILAEGNVSVTTDLTTSGNNSFPANIIGIMTPGNMILGESSQLDVMGIFYAQTQITTNKQTDIVGSLVTDYFDTAGQVPSIFQVPDAADNLPIGMIADDPLYLMRIISWQKTDNP